MNNSIYFLFLLVNFFLLESLEDLEESDSSDEEFELDESDDEPDESDDELDEEDEESDDDEEDDDFDLFLFSLISCFFLCSLDSCSLSIRESFDSFSTFMRASLLLGDGVRLGLLTLLLRSDFSFSLLESTVSCLDLAGWLSRRFSLCFSSYRSLLSFSLSLLFLSSFISFRSLCLSLSFLSRSFLRSFS